MPKLRFSGFETEYQSLHIGDFASCCAGATPSTNNKAFWENGTIPWLSSGEVNKKRIYRTDTYITQEGYDSCSTKLIPANTVVMALAGQGKTRGNVAITQIELCTNQSLAAIITNSQVDDEYLLYYLETQYDNLRAISSGDGTRGGLNLQIIREYKINTPFLPEQKKVAEFFTILDKRIDKQRNLIDTLISYKRGLSTALFSQKIRLQSESSSHCSNWKKTLLGDIFSERTERACGTEKLLAVTINKGVQDREELDLKNNASLDKSNYRVVRVGDLAYNTMRMWQGACGISMYNGIVSPAYTVLYVSNPNEYYGEYFTYLFKEISMLQIFQKNSQGLTSDTWNLKYEKFAQITVDVPPIEEQKRIALLLKKLSTLISRNEALLQAITDSKQFLLNNLFV